MSRAYIASWFWYYYHCQKESSRQLIDKIFIATRQKKKFWNGADGRIRTADLILTNGKSKLFPVVFVPLNPIRYISFTLYHSSAAGSPPLPRQSVAVYVVKRLSRRKRSVTGKAFSCLQFTSASWNWQPLSTNSSWGTFCTFFASKVPYRMASRIVASTIR